MTSTNDQALTLLQAADSGALDVADRAAPTIGQAANAAAGAAALADYRRRKSANSLRTQDAALDLFARFLADLAGRGRAAAAGAGWSKKGGGGSSVARPGAAIETGGR